MKINNRKGIGMLEIVVALLVGGICYVLFGVYQKWSEIRARQAEAQMHLTGIFAAQNSFRAEYGSYHYCMDAIGYAPGPGYKDIPGWKGRTPPEGAEVYYGDAIYQGNGERGVKSLVEFNRAFQEDFPFGSGNPNDPAVHRLPCDKADGEEYLASAEHCMAASKTALERGGLGKIFYEMTKTLPSAHKDTFVAASLGCSKKNLAAAEADQLDLWQINEKRELKNVH